MTAVDTTVAKAVERSGYEVRSVTLDDALLQPVLADLTSVYFERYSDLMSDQELLNEMNHYAASEFTAPNGDFILFLSDGEPVAGGAFRLCEEVEAGDTRFSERPGTQRHPDGTPAVRTAEFKRIWTHDSHRRKGLAKLVLSELEARAAAAGYVRVYLTTGSRQPEAKRLYPAAGYTPLFDENEPVDDLLPIPFEKWLD